MSALTAQLNRLQNRSGGMHTALTDKTRAAAAGVRAVPTILFTPHEARNITREQLLELALVGLRSLVAIDNRLNRPAAFLFSDAHTRKERSMFTREESDKVITPAVDEFLALLAPHIMEPAALQVLEYLIRVFEIHEFNAGSLLKVILPAHDQGLFVRVLLLVNLTGTGFEFLRANKHTGTVLPRAALVTAAKENPRVLEIICDIANNALQKKINHPAAIALFSFVASSIATTQNNEQCFRQILPVLIDWLPRARSNAQHSSAAQLVLFVWSNESRFSVDIIRVVFSTLCKLCRNLSASVNNEENKEDSDNDNINTKLLLDAYRLLAHLFNSQKAILTASATANSSTGGDSQLQASLVSQIVNSLPFNKRALSSFIKVSPWGFSLIMKHCFNCDFDDQESSFEFIEQCLEHLPLTQVHVQQILINLAQIFANTMSTAVASNEENNNNNNKLINSFCDRSVRILERRFSKLFDLALAELLKLEATFAQSSRDKNQQQGTNNKESEVITTFVLKYCTGSKYEIVDLSSSSTSSAAAESMKLPLIAALVHPVAGVRRLAATQLHNNNKSSSPALLETFIELLSLIEHAIKNENETSVLKELFTAVASHSSAAMKKLVELDNNKNNQENDEDIALSSSASASNETTTKKNQEKLASVLFESFKALMRFAPSAAEEITTPTSASNPNDTKSKFLKLATSFGTILSASEKTISASLSLCGSLFLNQLESFLQIPTGNKFFDDASNALKIKKNNNNNNNTSSLSFWVDFLSSSSSSTSSSTFLQSFAVSNWNRISFISSGVFDESKINAVNNMNSKQKISILVDSVLLQASNMSSSCLSKIFPLCVNSNSVFTFVTQQMTFPLAANLLVSKNDNTNKKNLVSVASLLLTATSAARNDTAIQQLFSDAASSSVANITLTLSSGVEAALTVSTQQQEDSESSSLFQAVRNASQLFKSFGNYLSSSSKNNNASETTTTTNALLTLVLVSLFSFLQASRSTSSHQLHVAFTNAFKELNDNIIPKIVTSSSAELKFFTQDILRSTCQQLSGLGEKKEENNNTSSNNNNSTTTSSGKLFSSIILPNILPSSSAETSKKNSTSTTTTISSLASVSPRVYAQCLEILASFFSSSTTIASGSAEEKAISSLFANSVAPLLKMSNEITHSPLPLQALVSLVTSKQQTNSAVRFSIVPAFLEHSTSTIKLNLLPQQQQDVDTSSSNNNKLTLLSKFPAEFVIKMIPEYVASTTTSSKSNSNKVELVKTLLNLQGRGCDGVTSAFARSSDLFEILVRQVLLPLFSSSSNGNSKKDAATAAAPSIDVEQISACAECIKFTLQEKSSIEAEIENKANDSTKNHGAEMSRISLTAAQVCVSTCLVSSSSSTKVSPLLRSTLLSTASSCLDFCVNFKTSLSTDKESPVFFFLNGSSAEKNALLGNWTSLVLAQDASTVHATMTLIESAVTLTLSSKDQSNKNKLSAEALNLLATVVMGAFEQKNVEQEQNKNVEFGAFNIAGLVRYSPTAAVQKLMKAILPALVSSNNNNNSSLLDQEEGNQNESDDDDDEDAPPVIFSRNKSNVLNKYNKKKQQQDNNKKNKKTPEELRAISEKRRQLVLDMFERAKTNLSLPLISLLIKMKEVASASQLQFKSPDSVLTDIVCSFDIIDQMACYRGMLEIWKASLSHAKGYGITIITDSDADTTTLPLIQEQMKSTDLRPFSQAIASFLQNWVEDSRFIDSFVKANTAAVVEALREQAERGGGSNTILSLVRTAPTLAPFCDSIFSAMSLFQQYKMLSLQESSENHQQVDEDDDGSSSFFGHDNNDNDEEDNNKKNKSKQWFVSLIGGILATMLSMVDEELFVVCIREIVLMSRASVFSSSTSTTENNNNKNHRSIAAVAARRIGLEILCDRLALSTTLGGSSARYTSKKERIARGATSVLSERVAQRILELLHRLLKELCISVEVPSNAKNSINDTSLETASSMFSQSNTNGAKKQQQDQKEQQQSSGARRQRGNNDATSNNNEEETEEANDREGVSESNKQYRGVLRRTLLAVPRENLLDVQWTVMCCEESARCFGAIKGDQLGLLIGTLARIGLDAVCFRGRVFPTVPTYRGIQYISSCAWKNEDFEDENNNKKNQSAAAVTLPLLFESHQLVLLCSIVTATSIISSTLGPSRMISSSGNDTLNLLTTSIRYSARMTHQIYHGELAASSAANNNGETKEALRQLRSISLGALRRSLPATWTLVEPFLPHIISSVTSHSLSEDADTSASSRELLGELDALLEPRVLFPCIAEALQQSYPDTHSFALLFQVIQNLISRLSKSEVKEIPSLMNCELFTVAFDKFAAQKPLAPIDTLRAAFSAFASFIVKFREANSKALCSNIVVWATSTKRSAKQAAPRANEIQRWTLCLSLFEYLVDRLGEVSDFVFPIVSPVIVDTLSTLSTTSTAPLSVQQYIIKNASQEATTCLESAFNCIRRMADVANEAAEQTNTATDSPDTPEALLPYFARPAPFEAIRDPLAAQLGNVTLLADNTLDFSGRAQESLIPCLRSLFKSLRNPKLWSQMQAAFIKNLRQPSAKARLAVLSLLRVVYADGGDTLASLVLAEALPAIVEATEDMDAKVAEEARLLCRELTTITGQDVLEYMTA